MTPRDVEQELAEYLNAAGLGVSTTGNSPSLYAGRFPVDGPDQLVCVRFTGGDGGAYLGGGGLLEPECQVVVRGHRGAVTATRELAVACWAALHVARVPGYVSVWCEGAGPVEQSPDDKQRPRFSFNVVARYVA
ncbi:hypothetical protein JY651_07910 [Pyxidicoccus parkwayensis]|uniref:Tail terminator n=1 Tax=Pyxidicoccus parkwayensis TaxID=2813578 RepID=A0ABX7P327_9BACT|nr:minor capsid protein [Pyxidicoccus parkwaysis]QSQ24855.1 hypothetical protein JY651_07910 [Pyxidicoccus parkwaysis]